MSEKKLTVAELMARAAAEEGQGEGSVPRRRRRRSLDEGGVSVAELTGSIRAVESKPAESRHSSVPLDDTTEHGAETGPGSGEAGETSAAMAAQTAADDDGVDVVDDRESTGSGEAIGDADDTRVTAETSPTNVPERGDAPVVTENTVPSTEETVVLSIVTDDDPIRLTTGEFPAVTPRQVQQERVAAPAAEVSTGTVIPVPGPEAVEGARTPAVDEATATTEMEVIPGSGETSATEGAVEDDPSTDADDDLGAGESEKISIPVVIGMILLGLVVGVALFFGFEKLWSHFNTAITAVLAVAVTGGIIGVVHALRTERDGLSMFLAGLAGLAVTFGPLLTA
ncbi:hypothetical protein [Corynebacterium sp. CCM 9204]|uniref:hypothetical protein n=1 Tax=Corynebacterium sp. CCM 9204 TaxID=3057616 RepID=UPI003524239C